MKKPQPSDFSNFIFESDPTAGYILGFSVESIEKKDYGDFKVIVATSMPFGRILAMEEKGKVTFQASEKWDFYEEAMAISALSFSAKVNKVLILGGGDCKIARIVRRFFPSSEILLVDILGRELCRVFPGKGLEDIEFIKADASKWLSTAKGKFDVIIGDLTDPETKSKSEKIYTQEFFLRLREFLEEDGCFVIQSGSPIFQREILKKTYQRVKASFGSLGYVRILWFPNPIYPGGIWTAVMASKHKEPVRTLKGELLTTETLTALMKNPPKPLMEVIE